MFHDIKNLLNDATRRGGMSREIQAFHIIEAANHSLESILPTGAAQDARAISFKAGRLTIECINSSAAHLITEQKSDLLLRIKEKLPEVKIAKIHTRLVGAFHDKM